MTVKKKAARSTKKAQFISALEQEDNFTLTENMALTHKSTLNSVLDLFAMGGAVRNREDEEVKQLFSKAYAEDELLALKTMFYLRDVRGGQGERKAFRLMLDHLCKYNIDVVLKNIKNIPEYGRYDDLKVLLENPATFVRAMTFIVKQLNQDGTNMIANKPVSLLAKWLPSENASSEHSKKLAIQIRHFLGLNSKMYRKLLSRLRKHIDIVERRMSSNEWNKIHYEAVPSKASLMYKNAFKKHDADRYTEFIDAVVKGEKKINAATLYPYEIVERVLYKGETDDTVEALWKNLPDYTGGENAIVVADVSGSMQGRPMAISVSLAMYFAERNQGKFNGYFITFSGQPALTKVQGKNFRDRIFNLTRAHWDMNTNLQGVFDLILNTAIKHQLPQEELPAKIYIVSDMEFDSACGVSAYGNRYGGRSVTNLEAIKQKFANAGYKVPMLVFWDADSRQNNVAAEFDERGVFLVSGASPSVFKYAMETKAYDPVEFMLSVLNNERYSRIVV